MIIKNSKKEKELEKKRYLISFLLSIIIYIILIISLVLFVNFKVDDKKEIVINVRLQDKLEEELGRMSSKDLEKMKKEQGRAKESIKKELEKSKKKLQEKIDEKEKSSVKDSSTSKESKVQNVEKKDVFEDYLKTKNEEAKKAEKDFFNEKTDSDVDDNDLNKLKDELSMIDKALGSIDSPDEKGKIEKVDGGSGSNSGNINWQGGVKRDLLYRTNISVSDKFKKMGLKTNLKLKFSVFENGHIIRVEVLESTGYPELDQDIVAQFKNWKFKESSLESEVTGVIEIAINY